MSDSFEMFEIFFLAMLAGFIALRLYGVLGRRTGEEKSLHERGSEQGLSGPRKTAADSAPPLRPAPAMPIDADESVRKGLLAMAQEDPRFEPIRFLEGARAAYGQILAAFWQGDAAALRPLVADDVLAQFTRAISARQSAGLVLDNQLVRIDKAQIVAAECTGAMAEITVRFDSVLKAITRNSAGEVVSGDSELGGTGAPVETHDVWTFSRHLGARDPNWLLVATDTE